MQTNDNVNRMTNDLIMINIFFFFKVMMLLCVARVYLF